MKISETSQLFGFTKSLRGRFAAYFILAIAISLVLSALISAGLVQRYLRQKTISDLRGQAESLSTQIENEGLPLGRYVSDLEKVNETRVLIIPYREQALSRLPRGPRGDEIAPTVGPFPFIDWELLRTGGTQVAQTEIPGVERDLVVVANGFDVDGELAGAVVVAKPLRALQSWAPLAGWFAVAIAVSLAVSLLMAILLARRLSRPLHEITQAAEAVAQGDFTRSVSVRSQDEIGRLADAFRYMSGEVQKSQEQQRQFVINVSHELRTPLTSIAGHARALSDGVASDPAEVSKSLAAINTETGRLSRLIEDLLSLAKFDARQFELKTATVLLSEELQGVAAAFARPAQEQGVKLSVTVPSDLTVTTDPGRLVQILTNLVQNALGHTPAGGSVIVNARRAGSQVELSVSDTGRGISPQDLPHVFDRFYRAGREAPEAGLGLGLSISRELARALGGDISVSSNPDEGTAFTVSLPAS